MKKALIVLTVFVVALAVCAPAFAQSRRRRPRSHHLWQPAHNFTAAGNAQAIDTTNGRVVVRVWLASSAWRPSWERSDRGRHPQHDNSCARIWTLSQHPAQRHWPASTCA